MIRPCACERPEAALVNPVFVPDVPPDGGLICHHCGGETTREACGGVYSCVTAGAVLSRLKQLGVVG